MKSKKLEKYFIELNRSFLNDIQSHKQLFSHNRDSGVMSLGVQPEDKPVEGVYTENETVLLKSIRSQIRSINYLVQVLDNHPRIPIRLRTYSPELVDSLIYQTQTLTEMLSAYLLPYLERTDSSRK